LGKSENFIWTDRFANKIRPMTFSYLIHVLNRERKKSYR